MKEQETIVPINRTYKIEWLKRLSLKEFDFGHIEHTIKSVSAYFNSLLLKDDDVIEDCGISSKDVVTLVIENHTSGSPNEHPVTLHDHLSDISYAKTNKSHDHSRHNSADCSSSPRKAADPSLVPKLTNPGYSTRPSMDELRRYTENELRQVDGFTVENKYGRIEFEGRTDVLGVNLDELVEINPKLAEVYPERLFPTEESKPIVGQKLNKPAHVILYDCYFGSKNKSDEEVQMLMKKRAEKTVQNS